MSSDEEVVHSEEEEDSKPARPSEAEMAMQKKKAMEKLSSVKGLEEEDQEMLASNQVERELLSKEIAEMKARSERRKKEREEEEKKIAKERAAEDARRKAEEEERKRKKEEEESTRREERAQKMAEFEKAKNPDKPNFVISRKTHSEPTEGAEEETGGDKKSKEQLEAEKKAILSQRIQPLNIDGADQSKLTEKAKELQALIMRLESEKYDLEKRFKGQQVDMMELAEKARQMNKIGRDGLKRSSGQDDKMAERFAGCPSKIIMYSEYERQKDPRGYGDRQVIFKGPLYGYQADRIAPARQVVWNEATGLPSYQDIPGVERPKAQEEEEEE